MTDAPEGRCMVCRAAWDPCRKCKGRTLAAKQEATMKKNGTRRTSSRGPEIRLGDPSEFTHQVSARRKRDE